jgi:protein SCO1
MTMNRIPIGKLLPILLLAVGAGCGPRVETEPPAQGERVFEVKGWVRSIASDRATITIKHEEIPGFMPAMTMPFYLKDPSLADGLANGDPVTFRFVVGETDSWIDRIEKIDPAELAVETSVQGRQTNPLRARIPRLEEGDLVPSFQLVNQEGEPFETGELYGKAVVVTFIFTRCPVPNFCPLMSKNFRALQQKLDDEPDLRNRAHLLSVTIDPEFDTPRILRAYANAFTDTTENWTFATGDPDRIEEMTRRFSIFIDPESGNGTIDHALGTALIGPDGHLVAIWRGNQWTPEEILDRLSTTLDTKRE